MDDDYFLIDCPAARYRSRSSIGGQVMTACTFCREVNGSTVITNHRKIDLRELGERLRLADDYELIVAERDHRKAKAQHGA